MYSPSFYREERLSFINQLLKEFNFATILTNNKTDFISHLPFLLSVDKDGAPELISHFARANPHWKELSDLGEAKVIFNGPHAYISPEWYSPAKDNVPTWNYAVVHAKGKFEIIEDSLEAFQLMDKLVNHFESNNKTTWLLPKNENAIVELMKGIVVFKIKEIAFEAKFKLAQKQNSIDRGNVITELENLDPSSSLACYMRKITMDIE